MANHGCEAIPATSQTVLLLFVSIKLCKAKYSQRTGSSRPAPPSSFKSIAVIATGVGFLNVTLMNLLSGSTEYRRLIQHHTLLGFTAGGVFKEERVSKR